MLRSLDALGGLWWKEVVLMDGPTSSWCTPVLELRLSHACTNHAVLPGEWAELCKRCVACDIVINPLCGWYSTYHTVRYRTAVSLFVVNTAGQLSCLLSLCKKQTNNTLWSLKGFHILLHW